MASFDGKIFSVSNSDLSLVAQMPSQWVDHAIGYVDAFAIDEADNFFLGVTLDQWLGGLDKISGALLGCLKQTRLTSWPLGTEIFH